MQCVQQCRSMLKSRVVCDLASEPRYYSLTPNTTQRRCNFDHLVAYAAQHQRCPVFGCDSHLSRKRSVVRDESLRAALAAAAPTPQHQWAWVRGDEVRLSPPDDDDARADPFGQAGSSATAPTSKRQRRVAGVDDSLAPSSAGKRRASGQQGSHAAAAAVAKHPRGSGAEEAIKLQPKTLVHGAECQVAEGPSEEEEGGDERVSKQADPFVPALLFGRAFCNLAFCAMHQSLRL